MDTDACYARHQRLGWEIAPVIGFAALAEALLLVAGALGRALEGMLTFGATLAEDLRLADTDTEALALPVLLALELKPTLTLALPLALAELLMLLEALAEALLVETAVGGALATLDAAETLMLAALLAGWLTTGLLATGALPASSAAATAGIAMAPTTGAA